MKAKVPILRKATLHTDREDTRSPIPLSSHRDQHRTRIFRRWLANSLFFSTGCVTALLVNNLTTFFHTCIALPSEFFSLIQQTQVANAMQSIEGIIQIVSIIFASYAFCYRHSSMKKSRNRPENE
jgi:hypothetical protein